jgi:hypothetical protein
MAINQVSLYFFPPRWQRRIIEEAVPLGGSTDSQELFEVARIGDSSDPPVQAADLKAWLLERGFAPAGWGAGSIWEFGQVRSFFGQEKEIEVR